MWKITSAKTDQEWTRQYVESVLKTSCLPDKEQTFGSTKISWREIDPGVAFVYSTGGSTVDRYLAEQVVVSKLAQHGIERAEFSFDREHRTSSWEDIMAKAKRLIDSGNVQLLRNGFNNIVAYVKGDHGEYTSEIGRDDPKTRAITTWQCECPWDQFAWQRTRKWKKYEGRPCHLPGAMISMADGSFKRIEQICEGDQVVTHDGVGKVTAVMTRPYEGRAFSIFRTGFPYPIRLTENHEVWAKETPSSVREAAYNLSNFSSNQGFRIYDDSYVSEDPEWIDSQDLAVHDWVASTWTKEERDTGSLALATILGYYISEGSLAKRSKSDIWGEVQWSFHRDETNFHNELYTALEDLGYDNHRTYYPKNRHTVDIRVTSCELANRLEELAGHLASSKSLASEVMLWPVTHQERIISAWANGDGDLKKDGRQAINTSSPHLARELYEMLVRCGYIPSWSIQQNNGGPHNRQKQGVIHRLQFKWNKKQKGNGRRRFDDRYMSKIKRIEEYWYEGLVWNLSVDHQESYVADGITNHNCAHVLAAFWQAQSTPLDEELAPGQALPPGQKGFQPQTPADITQLPLPGAEVPAGGPIAPPQPQPQAPGILPPFPGEQLQLIPPGQTPTGQPPIPGSTVSEPGARQPNPFNPLQNPSTYSKVESSWKFGEFENSDMVRLNEEEYGILEGKSKAHGAGGYKLIPAGSIGEVLGEDATTGWVDVAFPGPQAEAGPMEPYHVRAWIDSKNLTAMPGIKKPGPFVRRRI